MALVDVFKSKLFEMTAICAAVNAQEMPPSVLGDAGIFEEKGVETTSVIIEKKGNTLILVPAKPRGAPGEPMHGKKRNAISLEVPHLPVEDHLLADELQNVRAFGTENQLEAWQTKRDEKLFNMSQSLDNTIEYHRLGAIQGLVLDADGSTLFDLFDEFGVDQPDPVDFALDTAWAEADGGVIRGKIFDMKNAVRVALKNMMPRGWLAPCGDTFFRKISNHPEVRETYMNQVAANALRDSAAEDSFNYGGVKFIHYPGYGDVEIDDDKCQFVPLGVPGLFISRFAPAPWFSAVNTIGLPKYTMASLDKTGEKSIDLESQSNHLSICTRPEALYQGAA